MSEKIAHLIAYGLLIWLHLVTVHKILLWALGSVGMVVSWLIMLYITGVVVHEVEE